MPAARLRRDRRSRDKQTGDGSDEEALAAGLGVAGVYIDTCCIEIDGPAIEEDTWLGV